MDIRVRELTIEIVQDTVEQLAKRNRHLGVRRIKERASGGDDAAARDAINQIRQTKRN